MLLHLSIVPLNVESPDSRVVPLDYLYSGHEPCYSDTVGHDLLKTDRDRNRVNKVRKNERKHTRKITGYGNKLFLLYL